MTRARLGLMVAAIVAWSGPGARAQAPDAGVEAEAEPDAGTETGAGAAGAPEAGAAGAPEAATGAQRATGAETVTGAEAKSAAEGGTGSESGAGTGTEAGSVASEVPPIYWTEFDIEGELLEPKETVRTFLASRMAERQPLKPDAADELAAFCLKIGYHLTKIRAIKLEGGGIRAVLRLQPVTQVSWVSVDIENWRWSWLVTDTTKFLRAFVEQVFSDEIKRRLRLRPGSPLALDPAQRARQLDDEADRVADYLRSAGFFEARVQVTTEPSGPHSAKLRVRIDKGPHYRIGHIDVVGNNAVPTEEIVKMFHHSAISLVFDFPIDKGFSRQQLTKDIQSVVALYQKRGYPGVRVRTDFDMRHSFKRDSTSVEFTVFINERRKVDVVFESSDQVKLDDAELKKVLTFNEEGSYDDVEVRASAEAIRAYYQSNGYFEASVAWRRDSFEGFFERITFTIDRGPRLEVKSISFEGNQHISSGRLTDAIKTRVYSRVAILPGRGGYATSLQLRQDAERITAMYEKAGFNQVQVRVRVARDQRVRDNAAALAAEIAGGVPAAGLYIRFLIDEGPRLLVDQIEFEFLDARGKPVTEHRPAKELVHAVSLAPGSPYDQARADDEAKKLKRYYFGKGFPHADVKATARRGSGDDRMIVVFEVTENQEVSFGKLIIRGNFRTRDWVIRDELSYDEDHPLTFDAADRGQQNLRTAGLFKSVNVDFVDLDRKSDATSNILVRVEERPSRTFEFGLGGSTDKGAFLEAGGGLRSIAGTGLRADLNGQLGSESPQSGSLSSYWLEAKLSAPRWIARRATRGLARTLLGRDHASGWAFNTDVSGFRRREATQRFGALDSWGASLAFSKTSRYGFFRGWIVSLRYDWRHRSRDEELIRTAGASDDITKAPVTTNTGSIGPQLVIDKRTDSRGQPNPLAPERGFKIELRALFADRFLLGDNRFVKIGTSGQWFWKPFGIDRLLFSHGVRYDYGIPLGQDVLLPEVERFFAGGDTTVRGFEEDRLATEVIEEPLPPLGEVTQIRVLPAGGNIRFINNFDLQVRVWEMWGLPVTSALFWDTGLVTNSLDGFQFSDLRHAIGVALFRLAAPFGSLSIEYAVPLDPQLGDNPRGRFHFNIGLLF